MREHRVLGRASKDGSRRSARGHPSRRRASARLLRMTTYCLAVIPGRTSKSATADLDVRTRNPEQCMVLDSGSAPRRAHPGMTQTFTCSRDDGGGCGGSLEKQNKNEQAIRVSPNRLLVEDLSAIGYPRPAPSLTASDHVFFGGRTSGEANRSVFINLFPRAHIRLYLASVIPGCAIQVGNSRFGWCRPGIHTHDGGYGFRAHTTGPRFARTPWRAPE
jgi:hypothetical protein